MSTRGTRTFDPASLEILWSRLISITEECWVTLWRTAFSMIIGEAQDFGCELLDATGLSLAHSPRSMPVFNLTLPLAVRTLLHHFPPDTLEEGDVLATNDPWICAGHLYDVALVSPVFLRGRLVGLVGSIAHWSDIGGTRDPLAAREVYEEGIQIPPLKLYRRGQPSQDVLDLIRRNVRAGETVLGDLQAQLSANRVGASRLLEFMGEYGLEDLSDLARIIQGRAEDAMRTAIAAVPDGEYRASVECDSPDGGTIALPVRITVAQDELAVDWTGAPPQVDRGGVNCTLSYTSAHTVYALKCILTPEIPSNAGCFRPLRVTAPEGSILNCRYPAAVNLRTMVGWYCAPAVFGALAPALAARVQAFTGMPMGLGAYGSDADGRLFNDHLFQGGGQGAGAHGDGKSALLFPTSAASTSVEMFEARTALVVEAKELISDSGGAGRYRGGLGQRVRLRKLRDDGRQALISLHPQGLRVDISGLFGGRPGRRASITLEENGLRLDEPDLGGLVDLRRRDACLTIELAGGSGYGNPQERPQAAVQRDYEDGYVSADGLAAYGCRLGGSNEVQR
jgi:N-methylhydantoinase B/oxoprolinase/acetone carboxylase alpha subunit